MTPDQAPESCPFCGAAAFLNAGKPIRSDNGKRALYACGIAVDVEMADNRVSQTKTCLNTERERLTRDRDDLATKATALAVQVAELTRELEAHAHDLSPAMVQARNDQLNAENAKLQERIRTLEAQTLADSKELHKQDADIERLCRKRDDWKRVAEGLNAFMERARAKTENTREGLECLREFDALKTKEAKP